MDEIKRMVRFIVAVEPTINAAALEELLMLTPRELQVLKYMASDLTDVEISERLCIEPKSVANCKNRMAAKLNRHGRRTLYRYAFGLKEWLQAV